MCGRFDLIATADQLATALNAPAPEQLVLRYNIAPTQPVAALRHDLRGQREITHFHWGLIPSWSKDMKWAARMINARSETVHEKRSYRNAFKRRRCIVPATGFYEWQRIGKQKRPMRIHMQDKAIFGMAGLWESWQGIESCTILTMRPNSLMTPIHDRMPVILNPEDYDIWLGADTPLLALSAMFQPFSAEKMHAYPVSRYVGNVRNEGPACIAPIEQTQQSTLF
ncbi:MAG: SOS response-associated peptidase [Candidatus Promineifilaceae bacterium]